MSQRNDIEITMYIYFMKRIVLKLFGLVIMYPSFGQEHSFSLMKQKHETFFLKVDTVKYTKVLQKVIPDNYSTKGLGFFCRQEIKMQQINVPVTFRLGSMDYCNKLEQKPGY